MNEESIDTHIRVVGWLHIAGGVVLLLVGGFVFTFLAGIGIAADDAEAARILGIVGGSIGAFLVLLAIPGIVAGWGVLMRLEWARIMAIVVGILGLINIPIGTIIGGYTLYVLTDKRVVSEY